MDRKGKTTRSKGRARLARRRAAGGALALLVAAGLTGAPVANADPVEIADTLGVCPACVDTFEVKCTKASRFLQLTLEAIPPSYDVYVRYQMTAVGTLPATMDTQDFVRTAETIPGRNPVTTTFVRPGPEGTMRALVAVTSPIALAGSSYKLTAECAKGVLFGEPPITPTKTTVVRREDG